MINELDVPVLCMGLKDVVVSASAEGILVSDKEQSSYIKPYVDKISQQIMFAEKTIIDVKEQEIRAGDVIMMPAGCRHTIIADTELKVIEGQLGREISVQDKHKGEWHM